MVAGRVNAPAIRAARADDLDALVGIETAAFVSDRISRRSFRAALASASVAILVAEDAGGIVGYALVSFRRRSSVARLYSIACVKDAPSGCGRRLLAAAERAAAAAGATALRLEVRDDNDRAIALYRKNGYREIGRYEDYYEDGEAAQRFEKSLAAAGGTIVARVG